MLTLPYYLQSMRWVVPAGFLLGSAPVYYAVWGGWRIVSTVLPVRVFEAGDEIMYSMYQRLILFFFHSVSGIEIITYGDIDDMLKERENVIFMSNHQCTVDWMVADMLAIQQGSLGSIRYILKDGLKYLPLYGFYFRQHSCVYVKRSGQFNQQKMEKQLDMFTANKTPFWMVVFPEGTRFNPDLLEVIQKSRSFARSEGLPVFEHLLTPRLKALQLCVQRLRPSAQAVYDVTVAYSSTLSRRIGRPRKVAPSLAVCATYTPISIRQPFEGLSSHLRIRSSIGQSCRQYAIDFLQGQCKEVHIHVKRVAISDVPDDEKEFSQWLMDRFAFKDRLLMTFYAEDAVGGRGTFGCEQGRRLALPVTSTLPSFAIFSALNAAFWLTPAGRDHWWKLALIGTLASWVLVSVRS